MFSQNEIKEILDILEDTYPDAKCALDHQNIYQLLIAVVLSAQTTDKSVNRISPALFKKYPDALSLSKGRIEDIEEILKTIGMYHTKAKRIKDLALALVEDFDGDVPSNYDSLVNLPGVGRKTANVVMSVGFGKERIAVDTHVFRVSNRIGLVDEKDVLKTELSLMENIPEDRWSRTHHSLIFHGRNLCDARKPKCETCPINGYCKYVKENK
ncbi:MAG: endonuclease III [Clostridia bacterium]|nr:endonuclease III [Clostridia bacterium]